MKRLMVAVGYMIILSITPSAWGQRDRGTRTLLFKNQSQIASNVCVYQSPPKTSPTEAITLAWFCQSFPQKLEGGISQVVFQWTEDDYSFVLTQRGKLASGITFTTSQAIPANLKTANEVTLTKHSLGTYSFTDQKQGSEPNLLFINQDRTISFNEVFVGIGMAGSATTFVQGLPNVTTIFELNKKHTYNIFWGNYTAGQVLNINEITNQAKIEFKDNINSVTAILYEDMTWCVEQTQEAKCKE